jgi:outer membrane lipoprotein SlyB
MFFCIFSGVFPVVLVLAPLSLSGCGIFDEDENGAVYRPEQEQSALTVQAGVVRHVREFFPENAKNNRQRTGLAIGARDSESLEITISLDSGQETVVVRPADDFFKKGDRVRLLTDKNGLIRVQHE